MVWPFKKRDLEAEEHKRIFETALPGIGAVEELAKLKGQKVDRPSTKEEPSSLSKLIGFGKKTTVKICPEHGEVVPKEDNKCPQCGRQLTTKRSPLGNLLLFPLYLGSFVGSIYIFLNSLISSIFPYPEFIPALWFVILLVGFYIAYKLMKMSIITGIILTVITVAGLGIGSGFVTGMAMPGGVIENPALKTVICIFNPSNWGNQQAMVNCQETVMNPKAPDVEKKGTYEAISFKFGSEFTDPPYSLMSIQGDRTQIFQYVFPISIKNPSEDEIVKDFSIIDVTNWRTRLYNESGEEGGKIADLKPTSLQCYENDECDIAVGEELLITMDSGGDYPNRRSTSLTVKVSTEYSYSTEGKNEFVLARSLQDLKAAPKTKPMTGAGPVDVTVYFSPGNYVSGSRFKNVYLFITLANNGKGNAWIKGVNITKLLGGFLELEYCKLSTSANHFTEEIKPSTWPRLIKEQTHFCKYKVNEVADAIDVPFKTVPFIVKIDYDYRQSSSQEVKVERTI